MPFTAIRAAFEKYNCCVIIPTYNNSRTLKGVIDSVLAYTDDIIVVNDGSTDDTKKILDGYPDVQVLHLPVNRGKGNALRKGFKEAVALGHDRAFTIDS